MNNSQQDEKRSIESKSPDLSAVDHEGNGRPTLDIDIKVDALYKLSESAANPSTSSHKDSVLD